MRNFVLYILFFVSLSACSEYGRVSKKGNNDEKYDLAKKLYAKKDYNRALPLLEDLLAVYRGKEKSEEIYYYYSYCYMGLGQYELAAYHFKNFTENYYNSKKNEECGYKYVECLYLDALPYFLDQTNTMKAMAEVQLFMNLYPNSAYKDLCNAHIEDLRKNLKKKAFENAMLFFKIEDYQAAMVSFKNALKDFPDMDNKEEIEFMIVKSAYLYARYSIDEKKEERYNNVFEEFKEFQRNNKAGSKWYAEAEEYTKKARVDLNKHQKLNKIHQ